MTSASWIFFVAGAIVCLCNAYLALLRYPIHRIKGGSKESYKRITGWPFLGIFAVWLGAIGIDGYDWLIPAAIALTILDWLCSHLFFAGATIRSEKQNAANKTE